MALISQQVQALQKILKRIDDGTITNEEVNVRCKVHALIHKQEKTALQVMALSMVKGMTPKKLATAGLMSKNEVINVSVPVLSDELIFCPDADANIDRSECLDFSGEPNHIKFCQSCKHFASTRNLLLAQA
jgi:hypothetical protein